MALSVVSPQINAVAQASTGTTSSVAASVTNVQLLAANTNRKGFTIYNDGANNLFIKFGTTASTTSYTIKIPATGLYEAQSTTYTGEIDGIWDVASGSARITEIS